MRNDHLGWVLTCPSNLGTGLRAGAMVKVPLFSAREDFKKIINSRAQIVLDVVNYQWLME